MSNQSSTSNDKPRTVHDIIHEIEQKSKGGGYIYRGECKCNPKVSSKLYRDFEIENEDFDIELVQKEMLAAAKKHTGDLPQDFRLDVMALPNLIVALTEEARDFEILTEIQHYGGKTNLIDFTTDYFIALFFACDGRYDEDGRIILQKTDEIHDMIKPPRNPRHRVIVQKSVFIRPPRGFIEPDENDIITIPANLKQKLLQHLRDYHGIFAEVIYNDIHGFITNQNIHGDAYTHFYRGFASENRADEASTPKEKQQQYEEAIKQYTEAIELKPDLAEAYNNRGVTYNKKREFDNAIRDYTEAIRLKPGDAMAYNNRGNAYYKIGDFDNAIRDYTEAIRLKPSDAEAYHNRGNTYYNKGEFDNAIRDYNTAIKLNPDDARTYNNRGNAYALKEEFNNAIRNYTEAIKHKPDYAAPYNNRGNAYIRKGEVDNAIVNYTEAIRLNADYAEAHNNRGAAYSKKGELDNAIKDFDKVIQLQPDTVETYYNRGIAWLHLQEWEKAKSDLITAKDMGADIISTFHNDYTSVANFEQKTGIQLPEDIAAMLTPS